MSTPECGPDADGKSCASGLCCSIYGYCDTGDAYCAPQNCQPLYGICNTQNGTLTTITFTYVTVLTITDGSTKTVQSTIPTQIATFVVETTSITPSTVTVVPSATGSVLVVSQALEDKPNQLPPFAIGLIVAGVVIPLLSISIFLIVRSNLLKQKSSA